MYSLYFVLFGPANEEIGGEFGEGWLIVGEVFRALAKKRKLLKQYEQLQLDYKVAYKYSHF